MQTLKFVFQILLFLISIGLTILIIMQPSKGEGLGSIGGGGQMFFAKNKGLEKLLDRVTMWLAIIFGLLIIFIEIMSRM